MSDPDEILDEVAADVRKEADKTGRVPREILSAMRDEGFVECDDEEFERIVALAAA